MERKVTLIESINSLSQGFALQIASFNKSLEPFREVIKGVQKISAKIAKLFEKTLYLSPETYQFFLSLRVSISPKEIRKSLKEGTLTEEDIYTVYTLKEGTAKFRTRSFNVTKEVAEAIQIVIRNKPQFMFVDTNNIIFDTEKPSLEINGFTLGLRKGTPRYDLCKYMFGGKKRRKMPWELEDLVNAIGEDFSDTSKDWYHIIYEKYRALNLIIEDGIGYKDFFIPQNTMFTINPAYLFLLEK